MHTLILISVALLLSLSACTQRDPGLQPGVDVKTYEQTWPKPYAETSCLEWDLEMTESQKEAAAADLLWEHLKRNGAKDRPDAEFVKRFQSTIRSECSDTKANLKEVASSIGLPS